jgi:glycosyltransferase involved in cell wall biosynthesis
MTEQAPRKTILILTQVYVPDPTSLGQHMADAAEGLAERGHRVIVFTSRRGYDDWRVKYPAREVRGGVEVYRLPLSSFGKSSLALRLLAGLLFVAQCAARGLVVARLSAVLVSTSPPMCSLAALVISWLRGVPIKFWVMDLNPDQMIAMGKLSQGSLPARCLNWLNRATLRRAADVVTLDPFMAESLNRKHDVTEKLHILPPWPHDEHLEVIDHHDNPFRREHGLEGRFVVMYSGNHGLNTPVTTLLDAALRLADIPELVFMFIGGGLGKAAVERVIAEHQPSNIRSLPYQPLNQIKYSLSAADVHLVTMLDLLVGVAHPCKVYGAMRLQRPVLLVGPDPSHVASILGEYGNGWRVPGGDVDAAVSMIRRIVATDRDELAEMGRRGGAAVDARFSKEHLAARFLDVVERGLGEVSGPG